MAFDAKSASKSTIVALIGSDSVARGNALQDILREAGAERDETETFQADTGGPLEWVSGALTAPFFAERRTVIVRNIGRSDPKKHWDETPGAKHPAVKALKELPETSLVILVGDDELGDEDRQRRMAANMAAWAKIVAASGGKVATFEIDTSKTPELVRAEAQKYGKSMSKKAAETLAMLVSSKPSLAMSEIAKAALYAGDSPDITEQHIHAVVTPDLEYNVFYLLDAILAGQSGASIRQMRTLFGQTSNLMEQALPRVFPVFLGQLRSIWQARFCLDAGTSPQRPGPEVEKWLPSKKLSSESDWKQRKAIGAAQRLSLSQIGQCIKALADAEAELKGQKASYSAGETLERMALTMCQVCAVRH